MDRLLPDCYYQIILKKSPKLYFVYEKMLSRMLLRGEGGGGGGKENKIGQMRTLYDFIKIIYIF